MTSWNLRENMMAMTAFNWIGRALLALLFILAGVGKITGYDKTLAYMATQGVPGFLLPAVIALELGRRPGSPDRMARRHRGGSARRLLHHRGGGVSPKFRRPGSAAPCS